MERKEPYATQEEFKRRVIRYQDVPLIELAAGIKSHIVSAEKVTASFVTMEPNAQVPIHHHEAEQIMIIADGACDQIADGKLYHLEKGDVFIAPSNSEHGTYVSEKGCQTIEVFSPPRQDYVAKLKAVRKGLEK